MKNLITTITIIFLLFDYVFAQAPDTLWTKTFGGDDNEEGYSVQQTTDGGYIISGRKNNGSDVWLIKTDAFGDALWTKTFAGGGSASGRSVQQTTDGGYIITGYKTFSNPDVLLIKTDASGNTLWTKTFGGSGYSDTGNSIQQTTDGGYIIAGSTDSFGAGDNDVWLIKTDASGDTLWTKTFGGSSTDGASSVQQTTDGGYIIAGNTFSFGAGSYDVWLIKTDASGDTLWTKTFGGSDIDAAKSVQQTTDGGYIITGYTGSFNAVWIDVWLIKTDVSGNTIWTKVFVGNGSEQGSSVQQTTDGGYIIAGDTGLFGNSLLIKTDASGNTLWSKTFGGSEYNTASSVQQTTDGGYIITGEIATPLSDVFLIKTTPDITDLEQNNDIIISVFSLQQNYPNPFNPSTKIKFTIPAVETGHAPSVQLIVYDVLGKEIATLVNEEKPAGTYEVEWNATGLPSGVYFYKLRANEFAQVKKMILLK